MASACVNNNVSALPESTHRFFGSPSNSSSFDWFNPRSSTTLPPRDSKKSSSSSPAENLIDLEFSDEDTGDFEFRLEDPVNMMLPADELFFDGKLMPLHVSTARVSSSSSDEIRSISVDDELRKSKISSMNLDPYLFSPKAPRCSSGWRELLGLKRLQNSSKQENFPKSPTKSSSSSSLKHFMHRNPKTDSSLGLPLLKEKETESEVNSDYLPRVSLDSHKLSCTNPKRNTHTHTHNHPPNIRLVRRSPDSNPQPCSVSASTTTPSGNVRLVRRNADSNTNSQASQTSGNALSVSMDSPRMNSSGKVVFQSLERSSSSPSTFNGGPRVKYKGMERRSYSANVKVSPVLNVPVCSLRGSSKFGLGQLFPSPHKRAGAVGSSSNAEFSSSAERNRSHHTNKQKPPIS